MSHLFYFVEQDVRVGLIILFVCLVFTFVASFLDCLTKIEAVRAAKKKPESRPLLKTGKKIMDYYKLILFVTMVDVLGLLCFSAYSIPIGAVLITAGILGREGLSMCENFRLKKSAAAESVEFTKEIIKCLNERDAERILKAINDRNSLKERRFREE